MTIINHSSGEKYRQIIKGGQLIQTICRASLKQILEPILECACLKQRLLSVNKAESAWLLKDPLPQARKSQTIAAMFLSSVGTSPGLPDCHDQQVHIEAMNSSAENSVSAWTVNIVLSPLRKKTALRTRRRAEEITAMFRASRRTSSALHSGRCQPVHIAVAKWSLEKSAFDWTVNIVLSPLRTITALRTRSTDEDITAMFRASRRTLSLHRGRCQPVHFALVKSSLEKEAFYWPVNKGESAWLPKDPLPQARKSQSMAAMFVSSVGTSPGLPHCRDQHVHIEAMNSSAENSAFAWDRALVLEGRMRT
ncbi:hypothetical protein HPB50_028678 [Hyalomma asiaticum]|nr:hypothetical protein HPB50_028678 [Hyalomma asiaticum]